MNQFETWWYNEGSAMRPNKNEDTEQFAKRIAQIAWANGDYCVRRKLELVNRLETDIGMIPLSDLKIELYTLKEQYCSCNFVMIMRDTDTDTPYCSECKKEVKEQEDE